MSEDAPKKLVISHSEVTNYNECDLGHWFAHILDLRPYNTSDPLQYGINGHEILDAHFSVLKDGGTFAQGFKAAFAKLDELKSTGAITAEIANVLELHMQKYFMEYRDVTWRIIEAEKTMIVPLKDKPYDFGFKADLIVEILSGLRRGKVGIVDHKFLYNFWNRSNFRQYVQIPRYMWGARALGYDIDFGIIAQIRYRTFKDYSKPDVELFRQEEVTPTEARINNAMKYFFKTADEIYERRQLTIQESLEETNPTLSSLVCKFCDFSEPCAKRLDGHSIKEDLRVNFVKSDYGYNK